VILSPSKPKNEAPVEQEAPVAKPKKAAKTAVIETVTEPAPAPKAS